MAWRPQDLIPAAPGAMKCCVPHCGYEPDEKVTIAGVVYDVCRQHLEDMMARDRSKDEIVDQMLFAVACVANHYGPALSPGGLVGVREQLASHNWWCDAEWRTATLEGGQDGNPDFCPQVLPSKTVAGLDFDEVVRQSRTGEY